MKLMSGCVCLFVCISLIKLLVESPCGLNARITLFKMGHSWNWTNLSSFTLRDSQGVFLSLEDPVTLTKYYWLL